MGVEKLNKVDDIIDEILPQHVAIIMDGNGRWAKRKGKMRVFGHQAGVKSVRRAVRFAANRNIKALTLYAFSSENWRRPQQEVSALMGLFMRVLSREVKSLHKNNIKLQIIGDISQFSESLQKNIQKAQQLTENNQGLVLNIAANYGSKWDILQATKSIVQLVQSGQLEFSQISEDFFRQQLTLNELPDVDLLIRTGGEHRLSNFLLWQSAYAELYFIDVLWPDFDEAVFEEALNEFAQRERRFGSVS